MTSSALEVVPFGVTHSSIIEAVLGPICKLDGVQRSARIEAVARFAAQATEAREIPNGVGLRFPRTAALAQAVVDFVRDESDCCPALTYLIDDDESQIDLDVTGDPADVAALRAFYAGLTTRGATHDTERP